MTVLNKFKGISFCLAVLFITSCQPQLPPDAQVIIDRIKKQLSAYNKKHTKQPINISIGVSTANQGDSLKDHLKLAEKRMWQEKSK